MKWQYAALLATAIILMAYSASEICAENDLEESTVGDIFQYTYEGVEFTFKVLEDPTDTENGDVMLGTGGYSTLTSEAISRLTEGPVVIPENVEYKDYQYDVTTISQYAFIKCEWITSVYIPDTVTYIGGNLANLGTFSYCSSLNEVRLSNNLEGIKKDTFSNCTSLASIDIPDSVQYIETYAFSNCTNLSEVNFDTAVYADIWQYAFAFCPSLPDFYLGTSFTVDDTEYTLVDYDNSYVRIDGNNRARGTLEIPEDVSYQGKTYIVKVVGGYDESNIDELIIPDTIVRIYDDAFRESRIENIDFSNELKIISDLAFRHCTIDYVDLPDSLISIESNAFAGATIRQLTIPETVQYIDDYSFNEMRFYEPDQITRIDDPNQLKGSTFGQFVTDRETQMIRGHVYGNNSTVSYIVDCDGYVQTYSETYPGNAIITIKELEDVCSTDIGGTSIYQMYIYRGWNCNGTILQEGSTYTLNSENIQINAILEPVNSSHENSSSKSNTMLYAGIAALCIVIFATILIIRYKH